MAIEATYLPNVPNHPNRLTSDSRQTQTPSDPTIGAILASFAFLTARVANVRTQFQFFCIARTAHSYSQVWRALAIILQTGPTQTGHGHELRPSTSDPYNAFPEHLY